MNISTAILPVFGVLALGALQFQQVRGDLGVFVHVLHDQHAAARQRTGGRPAVLRRSRIVTPLGRGRPPGRPGDGEGGALALPAFDLDRAAHLGDDAVGHRQAHAAAAEAAGEAGVLPGEGLEDLRQERFVDADAGVRR